ncbi:MAG: urease accessory protein UreF [Pleurocapsa sp.]
MVSNRQITAKLALMQLADSFFPSGSFSLSHGLESLIQTGQIQNTADLIVFLKLLLRHKIGSCDLVALFHAHRGSSNQELAAVRQADSQLFAISLIKTTRQTQRQTGRALLMVAQQTWHNELLEILDCDRALNRFNCLHPVVFGVVGSIAGLNETDTMLGFLHSFVTGLLGAAIRLGVLGHLQAQQILLQLAPELETVCIRATTMSLDEMWSCTPGIDLAQMRHNKLSSRLFAS